MPIPLGEFFLHGAWATQRLIEVCAQLSEEQLDSSGDGAYGSIRRTLVHMLSAEQYYLQRIGHPQASDLLVTADSSLDLLERAAGAAGAAYADATSTLSPDHTIPGGTGDEFTEAAVSVFLIQALSHSAEHRAQILTILGAHELGPADFDAQIDGWSWGSHSGTLVDKPR